MNKKDLKDQLSHSVMVRLTKAERERLEERARREHRSLASLGRLLITQGQNERQAAA